MIISCQSSVNVLSKASRVSTSNGKTYYHLIVVDESGYPSELSCTPEVWNKVDAPNEYMIHFDLNPAYLRKEYNCSINIDAVQLIEKKAKS